MIIDGDILNLLIKNKTDLSLPNTITMDFLPEKDDCISLQPDQVVKLDKQYIDGSCQYSYSFSVLAATDGDKSAAPNLRALQWLDAIGALFTGMNYFKISKKRVVISADIMTPAIIQRTEGGRLVYAESISLTYEEER